MIVLAFADAEWRWRWPPRRAAGGLALQLQRATGPGGLLEGPPAGGLSPEGPLEDPPRDGSQHWIIGGQGAGLSADGGRGMAPEGWRRRVAWAGQGLGQREGDC